jgi:ferrous iron transport protein B
VSTEAATGASGDVAAAARRDATILLAGNPNAGKTSLFNRLTGARAKVGNYPGVTVERRVGRATLPGGRHVAVVDLPGTYSLTARSAEERVAVDALLGRGADAPDAVVVVADATALRRGLYLATQIIDAGRPVVLALNMIDEADAAGLRIDTARLARDLGCEVVATAATRRRGIDELTIAVDRALARAGSGAPPPALGERLAGPARRVEAAVRASSLADGDAAVRALALWAMLSVGDDELEIPEALRAAVNDAHAAARADGWDLDEELVSWRYRRVDAALDVALHGTHDDRRSVSARVDGVLVHPVWGLAVFALVMLIVFQALFAWSEPLVGAIEAAIAATQDVVRGVLPEGAVRDLLVDGIVAGVGNVVVFVPQIALLFAFITLLEDSGYLARVAFVIDRVMGGVGLHGRAFVPMLSGFACAIPAVMATRTLESRRDRLLTMLVVPLASCSARLPVYVLVTAAVFDPGTRVLGVLSVGAVVLLAMYGLSVVASLGAAAVLRRTVLRGPRPTLVLELPPYRLPSGRDVALATWQRVRRFLLDAGTVILALSIVIWGLLTYPRDDAAAARWEERREQIAATIGDAGERAAALEASEQAQAGEALRHSAGGRLGHVIEPVIEPLGFDWRIGVGIIGAFAAREVFVSTLGIVFDVGSADEESEPLRDALRAAERPDGAPLMTPLVGVSLMVFFVLACQCMSTIAVVRRESGSWGWAGLMVGYMTALAYLASLAVYQIGSLLGLGVG